MKVPIVLPLWLSLIIAVSGAGSAMCLDSAFGRLDQSALDAYSAGDYKKAQQQWSRLIERLNVALSRSDEKKSLNEQMETTLRHLGECALGQKNYDSADSYLGQAKSAADSLQVKDPDLDKDYKELAQNYRLIDLNNLPGLGPLAPIATAALSEFRPNKISVAKTDNGHHVSVCLADDVTKDIGAKGITQVGVSKNMSFDLIQGNGGEVTLANIIGIKVHAGFWVTIINSTLKLDESQRPVALVTAQKMGISQSVSTPVPDLIYLPVVGIVSQVKNLFSDGGDQGQTIIASPQSGVAAPQSEGIGIAPVTNRSDPASAGTVLPLPAAQTQLDVSGTVSSPAVQPLPAEQAQPGPMQPEVPAAPANNDSTHTEHVN